MNVLSECIVVAGPVPSAITWLNDLDDPCLPIPSTVEVVLAPSGPPVSHERLHRLVDVRRREGLTRRAVARRMGVSIREVEQQEQPCSDILVSDLRRWQQALAVPISELLDEPEGELSPPIRLRAQMTLVMKTIRSVQQRAKQVSVRRLAETLAGQLIELMPELADTAPWPTVGHRRKRDDMGQAFFRRLSLDPLDELDGPE
jgi:transcriptional regulator with XRE-family HTH domain